MQSIVFDYADLMIFYVIQEPLFRAFVVFHIVLVEI